MQYQIGDMITVRNSCEQIYYYKPGMCGQIVARHDSSPDCMLVNFSGTRVSEWIMNSQHHCVWVAIEDMILNS